MVLGSFKMLAATGLFVVGLLTATGNPYVLLKWTPPKNTGHYPIVKYIIYRHRTLTGTLVPIKTVKAVTTYRDTAVMHTTIYRYRIAAANYLYTSPRSNIRTVKTK